MCQCMLVSMVAEYVFLRKKGISKLANSMICWCLRQKHLRSTYFCHLSCDWDCVSSDHIMYSKYKCAPNALPFWIAAQAVWTNHLHPFASAEITRIQLLTWLFWPLDGQNEHVPLHVVNLAFVHVFWKEKVHVQISPLHHLLMSQAEAFEIHLLMPLFLCVWGCVPSNHIV